MIPDEDDSSKVGDNEFRHDGLDAYAHAVAKMHSRAGTFALIDAAEKAMRAIDDHRDSGVCGTCEGRYPEPCDRLDDAKELVVWWLIDEAQV